jgi:hypothetical protein
MAYSATIGINPLPAVFTVIGGGSYCAGGNGVSVSVNNSTFGVQYQLYNGSTATGSAVAGTGSSISFGAQTATGIYSVQATNASTGCRSDMSGTASVSIDAAPAVYTVSSGGSYCSGETGIGITLSGSNTGITYRLYQGTTAVGSTISGTGSVISFGTYSTAGTYSVQATNMSTGCQSAMSGTASISINNLPVAYNVTGGGSYCSGGVGVAVGLSNSTLGISYRLHRDGVAVGELVPGSGSALSFGIHTTAGNYTVTVGAGGQGRKVMASDKGLNSVFGTLDALGGTVLSRQSVAAMLLSAAIAAVLNPQRTTALYFVADGKGGHIFADTLQEHNANVAKWFAIRRQRGEM